MRDASCCGRIPGFRWETQLRPYVLKAMTEHRTHSGPKWQIWAGIVVFLGIAATVALAVVESWVG
jgi:hypothetical protein